MSPDPTDLGDPMSTTDTETAEMLAQAGGDEASALSGALAYADAIFETVGEPLLVLDEELIVRRVNKAFYTVFHTTAEETLGRRIYDLGNGQWDIPRLRHLLEEVIPEDDAFEGFEVDHHFETAGRRVMTLNARRVDVPGDRPSVLLLAIEDRTEQVVARREIARHAQELKQSNQDLERFAYIASHDLQEPLRAISGFLDLLERRYEGKLDDKAQHYISRAVTGADRMRSLIEGLLAYSRVESRGDPPEPVDAEVVLKAVGSMLATQVEETGGEITHGPLPTVVADREQLAHVFQNLISNALKFHRQDHPPHIHITAEAEEGFWRFSVRDDGVGIPEERQEEVFEIFRRLHPRDVYPGDGVGLALCRRIIDRHGGDIWVQSPPEGLETGATFRFTMPKYEETTIP